MAIELDCHIKYTRIYEDVANRCISVHVDYSKGCSPVLCL